MLSVIMLNVVASVVAPNGVPFQGRVLAFVAYIRAGFNIDYKHSLFVPSITGGGKRNDTRVQC
jgi:hypothetical protein